MSLKSLIFALLLPMLLLLSTAAQAQQDPVRPQYQSWGVRGGFANDPDQLVIGVHFDLGQILDNLQFRPNIELGIGDDHTVLAVTAPVHYRFKAHSEVRPYAGGGPAIGLVDRDRPGAGTDLEIALKAVAGAEWRLRNGNDFFVELNLVFGDLHDAQILAGWTF